MADLVRSLDRRLLELRQALAGLTDEQEVLATLSLYDQWTLRALERDFHLVPVQYHLLRIRLTLAYMRRVRMENTLSDTSQVTPALVRAWALAVLADGLTGVTDYHDGHGGQYLIELLGGAGPQDDPTGAVFQIATYDGGDPRRFIVAVAVAPITATPQQVSSGRQEAIEETIARFGRDRFAPGVTGEWIADLATAIRERLEADAIGQVAS